MLRDEGPYIHICHSFSKESPSSHTGEEEADASTGRTPSE